MSKRTEAYEAIFEIYKKEGREVPLREFKAKYRDETKQLSRYHSGTLSSGFRRVKRLYRNRWDEIGAPVAQAKPIVEPKVEEPKVEEPKEELTPLEKLRQGSSE